MALGTVGVLITRLVPRKTKPVTLRKTSPDAALVMAADYLDAAEDTTFGFPTGFFRVEESTNPSSIMARELVFDGSNLVPIMAALFAIIPSLASGIGGFIGGLFDSSGRGPGFFFGSLLGGAVGLLAFVYLLVPAVILGVAEIALRHTARASVTARAEADHEGGTQLTFELRGPSAWMIGKELSRAFDVPVVPERIRTLALPAAQVPTAA